MTGGAQQRWTLLLFGIVLPISLGFVVAVAALSPSDGVVARLQTPERAFYTDLFLPVTVEVHSDVSLPMTVTLPFPVAPPPAGQVAFRWTEAEAGKVIASQKGVIWTLVPSVGVTETLLLWFEPLGSCRSSVEFTATLRAIEGPPQVLDPAVADLVCPDLGDAADSANRAGRTMLAYPSVVGRFPTTQVSDGTGVGPIHWNGGTLADGGVRYFYGQGVSAEWNADQGPDQDLVPNLTLVMDWSDWDCWRCDRPDPLPITLPDGQVRTVPRLDDGLVAIRWDSQPIGSLPNYTMTITYTWRSKSTTLVYLNMWVDWNLDGDWLDVFTVTRPADAPEWVIQNGFHGTTPTQHTWSVKAIAPMGTATDLDDPALYGPWLRLSISDKPLVAGGYGQPGGYSFGETEDYYLGRTKEQARPLFLPFVIRTIP